QILLVFGREDSQSDGFWWAAERLSYRCTIARTPENALEAYLSHHHDVVIIDARQSNHGSSSTTPASSSSTSSSVFNHNLIITISNRSGNEEEPPVLPLLKAGFTRRYQENSSASACINELQTLEAGEVRSTLKLHACAGLFQALENVNEAVEITNSDQEIQFVNHAYERLSGYSSEELLGRDANEFHKTDRNREAVESINGQLKKGKHWEGTCYTRRKSGDTVPVHCKVIPIPGRNGPQKLIAWVRSHFSFGIVKNIYSRVRFSFISNIYFSIFFSSSLLSYYVCLSYNCSYIVMMAYPRRRESIVTAHSMSIEAPITKVINIINAAQEGSPLNIAQDLDKVLEILQTSELYSPFQHQAIAPNDDPMASDLVGGLMSYYNVSCIALNLPSLCESSRSAHLGHQHIPSSPACSLSQIPEPIMNVLNLDDSWSFDIIELERLTNKRPLMYLGLKIFSRFGVCEYLNISESCLVNWLQMIEANYQSKNHYHNSTHAADVLHATAYFLERERSREIFDQQDQVASLIAAVVHDVDHPARTNAFLINEKHQLAILYNDHDDYKAMRHSIIDMVLATDMKQHFEHLSKFTTSITKHLQKLEGDNTDVSIDMATIITDLSSYENRTLIKRMMIKCADVSNPLRPLNLCKEWAMRIAEEYCEQTDEEKSRGLPVVMAQFDRKTLNIPKCQVAFINIFITSMFDAWDVYSDVTDLMTNLQINFDYWKAQEERTGKEQHPSQAIDNS
ncbi:hypothetical protein EGW08_000316, partial [Elysia chlorotica]